MLECASSLGKINRRTVIANGDLETVAFLVVGDQSIVVIDSLRLAELFLLAWDFFEGRVIFFFFLIPLLY